MRRLLFILFLLPMLGFSQALQRQFFTTNTAPNVVVTAGTNAFITFSLIGQQRTYRVDTPASGTATNIVWPVQGTNVYLTTNGLAIVIDVPSPLIPWQAITNITSIQIPAAAVTNAPWSTTGQTNLALTIAGTNVFVHSTTNLGVTTYTIDVPLQPQQTNWPWQSITNIATVQIPYSAITNPPAAGGQTNLALVVSGTNVFVSSVTNLGVTTFTIDVPATGGSGQTNVTLVVQGTNTFVHSTTNSGVITYTIDVPTYVQTNIAWQAVTNLQSSQMPYTVITNAPWSTGGQTNLALVVAGTNAYVTPVTNLGVTTFTVDGPAIRTNWAITDITNSLNLTNWALLSTNAFTNVIVSAGSNSFVTPTLSGQTRTYTVDVPLYASNVVSGGILPIGTVATNNPWAGSFLKGDTGTRYWSQDGSSLTNVPFSIFTNYTVSPGNFTNVNGLGVGSSLYGMTSFWTFATAPNVGPIIVWHSGIDTNTVITTNGGTFTGTILDNSPGSAAPQSNQLVKASWVRGLFNVGVAYYAGTNIDNGATNPATLNQVVYKYQDTLPTYTSVRQYANTDFLTNNGYLGSVVTTNTFQSLSGTVTVNDYLGFTGTGGTPTLLIHPELYYSYDKTNWYGDFPGGAQALFVGTTNLYQWTIDFPLTTSTNANGFYVERRFKVDSVSAGTRSLYILVGTNAISGVNDASHINMQSPTATSGNAYLAANNVFTGSNYIGGAFIGNGAGLTNTTPRVVGITIDGGGSAITSGTKGFLEVPYAATIQSGTILADQVGSIQIETWRTNSGNLTLLARAGSLGTNWLTTTNWQRDVTLTGWSSVAIASNDILGFAVTTNAASVTRATLQLKLQP